MSREVANRSLAELETNRELAILLAAEAASVSPTAEAKSALRQSLFEALSPRLTLPGHVGGTYFTQFTRDGQRVITGGADKVARVWESDRGTMVLELHGHTRDVTGVDVTRDGTRICTSSLYDKTARVWDAANGKSLFEIKQKYLFVAQFSPDEKQILTVEDGGEAVLWDAISGQQLRPLACPYPQGTNMVLSASFSPDGNRVALVNRRNPAVCDVATGKAPFELHGHTKAVSDIGYSPDGQWLVTASEDHTARIWRAATGKSVAVLPHEAEVIEAMFSPGGQWIVTRTVGDRVVHVWDAASRKKVSEIDVRPKQRAGFALSPDGNFIAIASGEHTAEVFEARSGARVAELTGHTSPVRPPKFSLDRRYIFAYNEQGQLVPYAGPKFSSDGRHIVTVGLDGKVNLYAFTLGGTTTQLLALARERVPRPLTAQERAHYLRAAFHQ
jgi:WD40 repeat protein